MQHGTFIWCYAWIKLRSKKMQGIYKVRKWEMTKKITKMNKNEQEYSK